MDYAFINISFCGVPLYMGIVLFLVSYQWSVGGDKVQRSLSDNEHRWICDYICKWLLHVWQWVPFELFVGIKEYYVTDNVHLSVLYTWLEELLLWYIYLVRRETFSNTAPFLLSWSLPTTQSATPVTMSPSLLSMTMELVSSSFSHWSQLILTFPAHYSLIVTFSCLVD